VGLAELVFYQWRGVAGCSNGIPLRLCSHHRRYMVWLAATGAIDVREVLLTLYCYVR
jgi:hypothetical protein